MPITLQHDGTIDIATGRSRKDLSWRNREMLWSELVTKLSVTNRTHETYNEYVASKKGRQDEIKDVGGFVGGFLSSGRRKAGNVVHRQLLTLDIDFGSASLWEDFTLLYGNAALLYSTHKHAPDGPRYRLILPLDRPVMRDEYIAVARRIAGVIGIEAFDHTTFEPSRLMYWPSTSKDGVYVFEHQDGEWLSADEILGSYRDWRDSSEWPMSSRENDITQRAIKKQGDPLEKPGIVGAFCRTYTIHEVIETYLSDIYEPCDIDGRYTYKEGSTSGGLVVYEDKYAFSHHGTDPISGKLCNAFDLVRLHLYGLKDEDAREGTPGNKRPSYTAMVEAAAKDKKVRGVLGAEKLADAKDDFADTESVEETDDTWLQEMDVDRKGNCLSTIRNVALILENDPRLKGCFVTDEFRRRKIIARNLPWRKVTEHTKYLTDDDMADLRKYLERYDITSNPKIKDALDSHFAAHSIHPVRDYLNSLEWDGESRVEDLLIEYLGAEDNIYTRTVTKKALMACVARIYRPGTKFDEVLTLVGKQGVGKSTLLKKLGRDWFSDSFNFHMLQTKEAYEQIQGVWLIEIGELSGLRKADVEGAKSFISKQEDSFRPAYGQNVVTLKRQCVFFGTTNNKDFLRDPTGDRRFWPVDVDDARCTRDVFNELDADTVDQIWAEAVHLFRSGESFYLTTEVKEMALQAQKEHSEHDDRAGIIQRYLETLLPVNWEELDTYQRRSFLTGDDIQKEGTELRNRVCIAEIWCEALGGANKDMGSQNTKALHDIMRKMEGWKPYKSKTVFNRYGTQRGYYRDGKTILPQSQNHTADTAASKN